MTTLKAVCLLTYLTRILSRCVSWFYVSVSATFGWRH